jgi:LIVCS family branched-chain amino acid:cation transporter
MKSKYIVLSTGFALFSMFFGSGNLVFPLVVGQESQGHYLLAALGILLTGVFVPFLGAIGMMLYEGSIKDYFNCFGKKGTFFFSLLSLALMGPFGVLARCLTVAHGALQMLFPHASLAVVSLGMCATIYLLTVNKNKIVGTLGIVLTPFLLLSISAIAFFGFKQGALSEAPLQASGFEALKNGFFQGYQTMDLLAAFFFSTFVINHLKSATTDKSVALKVFLKSALIGGGILSAVYFALVVLGWNYAPLLANTHPKEMLGKIAMAALGPLAAPCVCLAVVLACLTTAIVLTSLFADFLRKEVTQNKMNHNLSLLITLGIGFTVSTLDFAGIARFIGPILETAYPALIMLTIVNVAHKLWGFKHSHWPVTLTFAAKIFAI